MRKQIAMGVLAFLPLPLLCAQQPPPAPAPKVAFVVKDRHGHAKPEHFGATHTAGGNTDVAQPRDDTLIITMTGVAVASPHPCKTSSAIMNFDLNQDLELAFADPKLKKARLTMEAQIVGLLRGDKHGGTAGVCNGAAAIAIGATSVLSLSIEGHSVAGEENLSVNDRKGPISVPVVAGDYHLFQTFRINAVHARGCLGKAAAAEFAPDPALDPTWITVNDPFRGANKKDFGFRVTLRLEAE